MRENLKKNQAITLVSLVVTIIILIILAGVSINLILGKNGIITIAKQAKENTELAKIEEEVALNELYYQISETSDSSISYDDVEALVEFKRKIASAITDMGIETSESASIDTMASNIRSISGASTAESVSYNNTNSGLNSTNVQGAVDEINNNLNNIEEDLSWKHAGLTTEINGVVTIPNTYKELLIFATPDSGYYYSQTSYIPFISGETFYINLVWLNNDYISFQVDNSNKTIKLLGTTRTNPNINVFYR